MDKVETAPAGAATKQTRLSFLWLEITGKCQLECVHCYAESSPRGIHGSMTTTDWERVIDQAAELGVEMVQFIGGEPTLHPDLGRLIAHARSRDIEVEVFSNLSHITESTWEALSRPGVRLATSYYSDDSAQHEAITKGRGSHRRTLDGIAEALRRDIPLRIGVIGLTDDQRVEEACRQLTELGVTDIGVDHLRQVGRGIRDAEAGVDQLCGNCADGVLAVMPDGTVRPCVFTRWMALGNVQDDALQELVAGAVIASARAELTAAFSAAGPDAACNPRCQPSCGPNCGPSCRPRMGCRPTGR